MTNIRKAAGQFVETTIDEEQVLLHLESGEFFALTGTARAVWEALEETGDTQELAASLAARFAAPLEQVQEDLADFLQDLEQAGLVVRASA